VGIKANDFTEENKNIILVEYLDNENIKIFFIKGNKVIFKEKDSLIKLTTLAQNIIKHYTKSNLNDEAFVGKNEVDEAQIIYNYINNKSDNLKFVVIPDEFISDTKYINNEIKKLFE
jgi:excinuclease ABC subunit C